MPFCHSTQKSKRTEAGGSGGAEGEVRMGRQREQGLQLSDTSTRLQNGLEQAIDWGMGGGGTYMVLGEGVAHWKGGVHSKGRGRKGYVAQQNKKSTKVFQQGQPIKSP